MQNLRRQCLYIEPLYAELSYIESYVELCAESSHVEPYVELSYAEPLYAEPPYVGPYAELPYAELPYAELPYIEPYVESCAVLRIVENRPSGGVGGWQDQLLKTILYSH